MSNRFGESYGGGSGGSGDEEHAAQGEYRIKIVRLDQEPIHSLSPEEAGSICAYAQSGEFPCRDKCAIEIMSLLAGRERRCPIDLESIDQESYY